MNENEENIFQPIAVRVAAMCCSRWEVGVVKQYAWSFSMLLCSESARKSPVLEFYLAATLDEHAWPSMNFQMV